ncbi:bifunctional nuclease family protein [Candidatus Poriferisodalis sp.]|uniref:bifunctional nuclease family protein n=1 Tax=Candidatus Poriferisodalis sp. TaxID=3101277 RepID=UPI002299A963|nr:bifunctional nuclease family protein [Acidimicrobiaceae bacterium]
MVEMELLGVQVEMPSQSPLLLLRETGGSQRVLPVVIDTPEAQAIYRGIEQIRVPRPLTHDLMAAMLDVLGATLVKVTVTDLRDRTFFAEMEVTVGEATHTISARPSDAVALAVRADTPIFASESVLDEAGQIIELPPDPPADVDPDELLDEFKQFLDDVRPDDFGPAAEASDPE